MILRDERTGTEHTVPPEGVRLGRDPSLEIIFPESEDVVSGIHAQVIRHDDESWWLEDLGSTNGTWLNGQRLTEPARLNTGMKFSLGQRGPVLRVQVPGELARTQAEPAINLGLPGVRLRRVKGGEDLAATGPEIVIGRSASCQIPLRTVADTVVSKRHASITFDGFGNGFVADLTSRNGTYLNGAAVQGRMRIHLGDRLMLGWQGPMFEVRLIGTEQLPEGQGAPYDPDREPRKSLGGMVAVAESEAKVGSKRIRTGVFMKSMARQLATESSPGFRIAIAAAFVLLLGVVGVIWRQSVLRDEEAQRQILQAEQDFARRMQHADSIQKQSSTELDTLRAQLETARRNSVSRSVLDSLERRLHQQESLATAAAQAQPNPQGAPATSAGVHDFTDVARDNGRAVGLVIVRFAADSVMGSGFAITPSGYFVTNRHVVQSENHDTPRQIIVVMAETNVPLTADVVSVSSVQSQDVAILRVRGYHGPAVRAVDWTGRDATQGAPAVMLGFPFGTSMAVDQGGYIHSTLFSGAIAQTGEWIRFSGSTYAGVSGSPVFNLAGEVIAVHFGAPREGAGLGISVPMSKVRRWLPPDARTELGL
ncbi:MAG TPA: FHA domain-containing protein [Gemmatimonadales bacterium]|jgi:pSer/pThr/pTyr-binding forkhead associated (FHA) protein/S1-C subfamily serine protease